MKELILGLKVKMANIDMEVCEFVFVYLRPETKLNKNKLTRPVSPEALFTPKGPLGATRISLRMFSFFKTHAGTRALESLTEK